MREYKIVFTGSAGAGKTTAIAAISDTLAMSTEVANTDEDLQKATTTVGMDFGTISLDSGDRVRLFGTPGQERFSFMWSILARGAMGLIVLVDCDRPDPATDLKAFLDGFAAELGKLHCVVGVGRTESNPHVDIDSFSAILARHGVQAPIVPVDVRRREDVLMLIELLLIQIEATQAT